MRPAGRCGPSDPELPVLRRSNGAPRHRLFGRDNPVGVARCQGEIQRGWSWCARRMSADDPSTRFISMSRKTNKYFLSWWGCVVAVRNPCHKTRGPPRHPAVTASQFCGHATGVDPHREDAGPIFLVPGGRWYRSIGLRVTAHQRQPRQFPFGYAGFGGRKRSRRRR